ncbi:MAG: hypothetical protein Q9208_002898 [Pyrenodesmia sp. 3 TL-2023]
MGMPTRQSFRIDRLPLTDARWDDRFDQNGIDRDHAKVYVGSFKHAMFLTRYTFALGGQGDKEWRSNDWFFIPMRDNELIDGLTIPDFNYVDAASTPRHMHENGNICRD